MALHVELLEESFDRAAARADELLDRFHGRPFAQHPELSRLFDRADLSKQKKLLLGTLVLLRKSPRNLDVIVPALESLGARHVRYGVEPAHYPLIGAALVEAMAEIGGTGGRLNTPGPEG